MRAGFGITMGGYDDILGAVRKLRRSLAFRKQRWSARKVEVVQRTWKALQARSPEATTVGLAILGRFFRKSPAFLQLFPFRDQPTDTLFLNAKVKLHAKLLADTLSKVVGLVGDIPTAKSFLRELGGRHTRLYKVKPGHYKLMGEAVLEEVKAGLGEEGWTGEVEAAWNDTWAMISKAMQKGNKT